MSNEYLFCSNLIITSNKKSPLLISLTDFHGDNLIFHFVIFRTKFTVGKVFFPLILITIVNFLGGIGSTYREYWLEGLSYLLSASVVPLFIYTLFYTSIDAGDTKKTKDYFFSIFIALAIATAIEVIALKENLFLSIKDGGYRPSSELGWLNTGSTSYFFHLALCIFYYLFVSSKKYIIPLILSIGIFVMLFYVESDSGLGTESVLLPFILILSFPKLNKEKKINKEKNISIEEQINSINF